jgi:hypothetical protein
VSKILVSLYFVFFALTVNATTFRKLPLGMQVEESTAAAEVKLVSKRTYMNKIGLIFTEHMFQVVEGYNLEGDAINDVLKLELTGGTINGVTSFVDGAPEFSIGEKSFLLLKKIENKLYISNFTLGKYKVVEEGDRTFYVSSVYPTDPELGKVSKERMIELIKKNYKISETTVPMKNDKKFGWVKVENQPVFLREPAQVNVFPQAIEHKPFPIMLLIVSLMTFIISGFIGFIALRKED